MKLPPGESTGTCEVVQVRLFDTRDGPRVVRVFQQRGCSLPPGATSILYHSLVIDNDWSIYFWRPGAESLDVKSAEATNCAEALRPLGFVDHSTWRQVITGPNDHGGAHTSLER